MPTAMLKVKQTTMGANYILLREKPTACPTMQWHMLMLKSTANNSKLNIDFLPPQHNMHS